MTPSTSKLNLKSHPSDTLWVGIDVPKNELQLHFPVPSKGLPAKISYDKTSLAKLTRHLAGDARFHVVFEATGGYDNLLRQCLHAHGIRCTRANPRHVRNFARSKGLLAKTDRIDAAVLADFGAAIQPAVTPEPDPTQGTGGIVRLSPQRDPQCCLPWNDRTGPTEEVALIAIIRRLMIHLNSIMTKVLKNPIDLQSKHLC